MNLVRVYDAASALDAAMVADILTRDGIDAQVFGADLQGGIGELPAGGLVQVMAPEHQAQRAREIITEWEQSHPAPGDQDRSAPSPRYQLGLPQFVSGIFAGVALTLLLGPGLSFPGGGGQASLDQDGDGHADAWWYYQDSGELREYRADMNGDGRVDITTLFESGLPSSGEQDLDGNGHFEGRWRHRGLESWLTEDRNGDGVIEYREAWSRGLLTQQSWYDLEGQLIKRAHYQLGHLIYSEEDRDGDGELDRRTDYNWYAEPLPR